MPSQTNEQALESAIGKSPYRYLSGGVNREPDLLEEPQDEYRGGNGFFIGHTNDF